MDKSIDLAFHRLNRAKEDLKDSELLYKHNSFKSANNRAYYAIFHAIRAILALEKKDFKRHKDVLAYFNQYYIKPEKFPRMIGKKINNATKIREDSDYNDEFIVEENDTHNQIEAAKELIILVEKYIDENKS